MPTQQADIATDAELEAGAGVQYHWAPAMMAAGLYNWRYNGLALGAVGNTAANAICCFDYPVLLALRRGYLTPGQFDTICAGALGPSNHNRKAGAFSYYGYIASVWRDWSAFPLSLWRPRRGDLVFFNLWVGGDLNHVVVSRGTQDAMGRAQVVSFGEGLAAPQQAAVNFTTVEQLRAALNQEVKFAAPVWSSWW